MHSVNTSLDFVQGGNSSSGAEGSVAFQQCQEGDGVMLLSVFLHRCEIIYNEKMETNQQPQNVLHLYEKDEMQQGTDWSCQRECRQ